MRIIAIPANRMPVFRRDGGRFLDKIEDECKVEASLKNGELHFDGEAGDEWAAEQVAKAVVLGFKPRQAFKLLKDDYFLEEVDLKDVARNEKELQRFKSRVIGSEGKAKKTLQELSGAWLSISGGTVAFLGKYEDVQLAREGIQKIVEGKSHSTVYSYLEKRVKQLLNG